MTANFVQAMRVDVLSEVLRAVRLEGALFFNAEFTAPWCISAQRSDVVASRIAPGAEHLIIYHLVTEGRGFARFPGGQSVPLTAGDIVVFPHGDAHLLGNGAPERPVDSLTTFDDDIKRGLKIARFGGGGEVTRFVCGFMACEPRLSEIFLSGLPPMLIVNVAKEASGQWLEQSIRFSVDEANGSSAGSGLVLAKLSEVLFVETLRRYIGSLPEDQTGWLAGARDPFIGKALALMHAEPGRAWTISDLAHLVGLSRTRFAEQFRHFLGESPMAYLARWRMKLAAELLRSTSESVAEIAATVGYGSEAAFCRAFRREFDCPPAQFRRRRNDTPARIA